MVAKSILEVEVRDEAFQRLKAEFDRYKSAVKDLPGDWAKVGEGIAAAQPAAAALAASTGDMSTGMLKIGTTVDGFEPTFADLVDSMRATALATQEMAAKMGGVAKEADHAASSGSKFLTVVNSTSHSMTGLARSTKSVAGSITEATEGLQRGPGQGRRGL